MGWLILSLMAVSAFALLWRYGTLPHQAVELCSAALILGIAGYAWQGVPDQPGTPVAARQKAGSTDDAAVATRQAMSGRFGTDAQWLDLADRLIAMGQTQTAVVAVRSGIRDHRNSPELWVGLGNALVAHGEGLVSPAAVFAYRRAAQLSPDHPAPPFFYGVALAQAGRHDEAAAIWRRLLARAPKDAPWRADVETRLAQITESAAP